MATARAVSESRAGERELNKVKLVAVGLCFLLFLACLAAGGHALYARLTPPPPPTVTEFRQDYPGLIAERDAKAKAAVNLGKEAWEQNDYAAALAFYKEAAGIWKANLQLIENLGAREDLRGADLRWTEKVAVNENMFLRDANQAIYELELLLARQKREGVETRP